LTANAVAARRLDFSGEEKTHEAFADPSQPALFGCQGMLPASGSAM
jgi:hypothetical protein